MEKMKTQLVFMKKAKMLNFKESTVSSGDKRHQMPKPDKLVNKVRLLYGKKNYFRLGDNTNRLRNLQENKFAYKQDEDDIVEQITRLTILKWVIWNGMDNRRKV